MLQRNSKINPNMDTEPIRPVVDRRASVNIPSIVPGVTYEARRAYVGKISQQDEAKRIIQAVKDYSFDGSESAESFAVLVKITDQDFLEDVAMNYKDIYLRSNATLRLDNKELLKELAKTPDPEGTKPGDLGLSQIRNAATERLAELERLRKKLPSLAERKIEVGDEATWAVGTNEVAYLADDEKAEYIKQAANYYSNLMKDQHVAKLIKTLGINLSVMHSSVWEETKVIAKDEATKARKGLERLNFSKENDWARRGINTLEGDLFYSDGRPLER